VLTRASRERDLAWVGLLGWWRYARRTAKAHTLLARPIGPNPPEREREREAHTERKERMIVIQVL